MDPEYFDSQAAASARLDIPLSDLRHAKARGCKAFRSGRVYRKDLLAWFVNEGSRIGKSADDAAPEFTGATQDWSNRLEMVFANDEFLGAAFHDGQLTPAQYRKIGDRTIPLLLQLAKIWDAGIDETGYLRRWLEQRPKV